MYRKLILIFLLSILTTNASVSVPSNLIIAAEKEDTLEKVAGEYVKEAERIFKETENDIEERRSRISQFTSKVTKVLSTPFTKALTKVTLIQMEVICSAIDDFESAGFACFPQLFILSEVLGKKYVDSGQLIQALSNKRNDWKFRWLIAEMLGRDLRLEKARVVMIEIILDENENKYVRSECILGLQAIIGDGTFRGKSISQYIIKLVKSEKEVRGDASITLGTLELMAKKGSVDAIEALALIKTPQAIKVLKRISKDESDVKKEIRERAKILLKEIK